MAATGGFRIFVAAQIPLYASLERHWPNCENLT